MSKMGQTSMVAQLKGNLHFYDDRSVINCIHDCGDVKGGSMIVTCYEVQSYLIIAYLALACLFKNGRRYINLSKHFGLRTKSS